MYIDYISLIIRVLILFFTAMTSQIAFERKFHSLGFFLLAVWVTIFRLAFYRAATAYLGVFQHETNAFIVEASKFVQSSNLTNITDGLILIGVIFLFMDVTNSKWGVKLTEPKNLTDNNKKLINN